MARNRELLTRRRRRMRRFVLKHQLRCTRRYGVDQQLVGKLNVYARLRPAAASFACAYGVAAAFFSFAANYAYVEVGRRGPTRPSPRHATPPSPRHAHSRNTHKMLIRTIIDFFALVFFLLYAIYYMINNINYYYMQLKTIRYYILYVISYILLYTLCYKLYIIC